MKGSRSFDHQKSDCPLLATEHVATLPYRQWILLASSINREPFNVVLSCKQLSVLTDNNLDACLHTVHVLFCTYQEWLLLSSLQSPSQGIEEKRRPACKTDHNIITITCSGS